MCLDYCAGTTGEAQNPSSKQLRMLARKLSQAEPGLKLSDSTLKQASDLISQATAKIEAQMRSGTMDNTVLNGLSQVRQPSAPPVRDQDLCDSRL